MGDEDETDADTALQLPELDLHVFAQLLVERAQGLVQQQHLRPLTSARAKATRWRWPPDIWSCFGR